MDSVLLITKSDKGMEGLKEILTTIGCHQIDTVSTGSDARRLLMQRDFDLCVINAPLADETGETLSKDITTMGISQVVLIVAGQYLSDMAAVVEEHGVLTLGKPVDKHLLWTTLRIAKATHHRMMGIQQEKNKLLQRIDDIRMVNRAKTALIERMQITEEEAHKMIEKQAMDTRLSRREIAERILRTYDY